MAEQGIIILGVIGLFGNTLAVIIGAFLSARYSRRAQEDAVKAQIATSKAAQALEVAKLAAAKGARELVEEARRTNKEISSVVEIAEGTRKISQDTNEVAHTTHRIINGHNTKLLHAIMLLTERVAKENPEDQQALRAAQAARDDYNAAIINKKEGENSASVSRYGPRTPGNPFS